MINIKCKTAYCNTLINKQYNEYDSFDSNWASEIESINPSGQSQGNEEVDKYKTTSFWEVIKDIFK